MIKNIIFQVKETATSKTIYLFFIPLCSRKNISDYKHYSFFFSFLNIKRFEYKSEYYFFKLKLLTKLRYEEILHDLKAVQTTLKQDIEVTQLAINQHISQLAKAIEIKTDSRLKTLIQCQLLHKKTFGPYKDSFEGKKVVLVASGPTAKYYEYKDGFIYVGVNNSCLLENIKLDYLFCQDFYMDREKRDAIVNYRPGLCKKFFGRIPDVRYEKCLQSDCAKHVRRAPKYLIKKANADEYYIQDEYVNSFSLDIECEPLVPCGIVFSAMQFILHCHPKEIYLVGCDCSAGFFYKSNITFDASYQINTWKRIKRYMDDLYPDIEMFSINPIGLKGLFHDIYTDKFLAEHPNI